MSFSYCLGAWRSHSLAPGAWVLFGGGACVLVFEAIVIGLQETADAHDLTVDAFLDAIRDTFLGVRRSPLTWRAPPGKQFTTTRRLRPGYDPEQVDAFLDKAEPRLAAMPAADKGAT